MSGTAEPNSTQHSVEWKTYRIAAWPMSVYTHAWAASEFLARCKTGGLNRRILIQTFILVINQFGSF